MYQSVTATDLTIRMYKDSSPSCIRTSGFFYYLFLSNANDFNGRILSSIITVIHYGMKNERDLISYNHEVLVKHSKTYKPFTTPYTNMKLTNFNPLKKYS